MAPRCLGNSGRFRSIQVDSEICEKTKSIESGLCVTRHFINLRNTHPKNKPMIRCNLSTLMGRDKLRISDVVRETGLNRSTVTALYKETATRVDLPAVDRLCRLFRCQVGELFEHLTDAVQERP